jgi:hypothetical protein
MFRCARQNGIFLMSAPGSRSSNEVLQILAQLRRINRSGGLGYEAHDTIEKAIEFLERAEPKPAASKEILDDIMADVQSFASAWSLIDSRFDGGHGLQAAMDEKAELRARIEKLITAPEPCTVYGGEVHICKNGKYQINRKESCHHCSEITTRAVEIDGDLFNVPEPVAKAIARLRAAPPPSAVLVNAFRAGAFYGCAEEFNPLDLQRDAEAYGSRHSPTKAAEL